jgi:D-alanyl-D-alanine carboxypeptidase (penicillin-binding protein 5/6)
MFGAAAVAIALGLYLPLVLLAPLAPTAARTIPFRDPPRTTAALTLPAFGASAIGAIGYPGVLAAAGSANPLPIASISKIVTALVVLKARPLAVGSAGPTITLSAADEALTAKYTALDGETKPLHAGSTISQLDLMRVALVASANNYADVLARWGFGSHAAFESAVGRWLAVNGLWHTTILEPTGINPGNVSTAPDLVRIGKLALANPVLSTIVSTRSMTQAGVGTFANTNTLLGRNGVEGIKTGTLNGKSNLLFAADYTYGRHTITVVGAVIGGADHAAVDAAVTTLLAGMKAGFHEITLAKKGQSFAIFTTPWSDRARAVSTRAASVLVWSNTPVTAIVAAAPAGVSPGGHAAGRVTFTAGSQTVTVPLELDHGLSEPGFWWRVGHPAELLE